MVLSGAALTGWEVGTAASAVDRPGHVKEEAAWAGLGARGHQLWALLGTVPQAERNRWRLRSSPRPEGGVGEAHAGQTHSPPQPLSCPALLISCMLKYVFPDLL